MVTKICLMKLPFIRILLALCCALVTATAQIYNSASTLEPESGTVSYSLFPTYEGLAPTALNEPPKTSLASSYFYPDVVTAPPTQPIDWWTVFTKDVGPSLDEPQFVALTLSARIGRHHHKPDHDGGPDVPEAGNGIAGVLLLGAVAGIIYRRKH